MARDEALETGRELAAEPPKQTLITVMGARFIELRLVNRRFNRNSLAESFRDPSIRLSDDPGDLILIPAVAHVLSIPIEKAIDVTYLSVIMLGGISLWIALRRIAPSTRSIFLSMFWGIWVLVVAIRTGDVYILSAVVPIAIIPWVFVLKKNRFRMCDTVLSFAVAGLVLGCSHTIRSHSGTATAMFLLIVLWCTSGVPRSTKAVATLTLAISMAPPVLFVRHIVEQRAEFLRLSGSGQTELSAHPFWHSCYIGLGFLSNPDIPQYRDEVAVEKVCSVDSGVRFASVQYERILRAETLRFARTHARFVALTLAAKAGVVALLLLIYSTPFAFFGRFHWYRHAGVHLAFILAISFSCLPSFVAVPNVSYLLGAISCSMLYGLWRWQISETGFDSVSQNTTNRTPAASL